MYLPLLADKLNGKKINFTTAYIQKAPKPEIVEDDPVPAVPLGSQYDRRGWVGLARDPGAVEHERGQEYTNYHHHHCGDLERESPYMGSKYFGEEKIGSEEISSILLNKNWQVINRICADLESRIRVVRGDDKYLYLGSWMGRNLSSCLLIL